MSDSKIHALVGLSLIGSPVALPPLPPPPSSYTPQKSAAASSQKTSWRNIRYQLAPPPQLQPRGAEVGELQERWQFPSDHLPIGGSLGNLHFASWNVLGAKYMNWVTEKNSQGLSRSMIVDEHIYLEGSNLTVRDQHVVRLIIEMLQHPTHPKHLISLQECSEPFLLELQKYLPPQLALFSQGGEAMLVDQEQFEVLEIRAVSNVFSNDPTRTFQEMILRCKTTGETFQIVNAHLPGDPLQPGRFEFAQYLAQTFDSSRTILAMGDMNFNELEMADAVERAFLEEASPFSIYSPYCTNIAPPTPAAPNIFYSKAIDHFIVYEAGETKSFAVHEDPNQVMLRLSDTADLLQ